MTTSENAHYRKQKQTEAVTRKNELRNARIRKLHREGHVLCSIAEQVGLSKRTVQRVLKQNCTCTKTKGKP